MGIFTPFDRKVDPRLEDELSKVIKVDNMLKATTAFESSFAGKSLSNAASVTLKVLTLLKEEDSEIKEVFSRNRKNVTEDDLEEVTNSYSKLLNMKHSIYVEIGDLHKVCLAAIQAVDILVSLEKNPHFSQDVFFNGIALGSIKDFKEKELKVLNLSDELVKEFNKLFLHLDAVTGMAKTSITDSDKEWDSLKEKTFSLVSDMERCGETILAIANILSRTFSLVDSIMKNDIAFENKLRTQMNILRTGSEIGHVPTYSGESFTAKDRRPELMAYASDLEKQEKDKKKLKVA